MEHHPDQSSAPRHPFREHRRKGRVLQCPFQGESIPMILRHADVRAAAKDWKTFSSDVPFRVPIPSEEELRTVRQLPIERDPPEHTEYRKIVEPFFKRPKDPAYVQRIGQFVSDALDEALGRDSIEFVRECALPLQSRALTLLLGVPETEAEEWIDWGIHVFKDGNEGEVKGATMERYLNRQLDRAEAAPGDDFFSALVKATYQGRPLTREEMVGFGNLTFAGGRDTVIHTLSNIIAHLATTPTDLTFLQEDPTRIKLAGEEFVRAFMPLTHIGRVCPVDTEVHGVNVPAGGRVSLCWSSANQDENVFDSPEEVRLDRKPNPHLAFGFGAHLCLGALHMRVIMREFLAHLCPRVTAIEVLEAQEHIEVEPEYRRSNGYDFLRVRFRAR